MGAFFAAMGTLFASSVIAAEGPQVTTGESPAIRHVGHTAPSDEAIVRKAFSEGLVLGRMDTFYDLFDRDFVDHTPLPRASATREGMRHLYITLRDAFPDLRATSEIETGEGKLITVRRTFEGTHRGAAFMSVPATGNAVRFEAMDIVRVRGGKITERWGVIDVSGLLLQLRGVPAPRPNEIVKR